MALTEQQLNFLMALDDTKGRRTPEEVEEIADLLDELQRNGDLKTALALVLTSPREWSRVVLGDAILKRLGIDKELRERVITKAGEP